MFFPLVIAVGRNDAPLFFDQVAEGGFFRDGLAARVDHAITDRRIFRPMRNQSPAPQACRECLAAGNCRCVGSWRDSVAGVKRSETSAVDVETIEAGDDLFRRVVQGETATHV